MIFIPTHSLSFYNVIHVRSVNSSILAFCNWSTHTAAREAVKGAPPYSILELHMRRSHLRQSKILPNFMNLCGFQPVIANLSTMKEVLPLMRLSGVFMGSNTLLHKSKRLSTRRAAEDAGCHCGTVTTSTINMLAEVVDTLLCKDRVYAGERCKTQDCPNVCKK